MFSSDLRHFLPLFTSYALIYLLLSAGFLIQFPGSFDLRSSVCGLYRLNGV